MELGLGEGPGAVRGRGQVVQRHRPAQNVECGEKVDPALAWWSQNSKCAYQEAFNDLDRALRDFVTSKKGQRKGKRLGFPKAKKRTCSPSDWRRAQIQVPPVGREPALETGSTPAEIM